MPAQPRRSAARSLLSTLATTLTVLLMLGGLGVGGYLVYQGMRPQEIDAPLPEAEVSVGADAPVAGPDGTSDIALDELSDAAPGSAASEDEAGSGSDTGAMSTDGMAPNSVFVPSLGAYSTITGESSFEESRYSNFDSLVIPDDPRKTAWYSEGAPLAGGDEGTTLLASHVSRGGVWGVFHDLYTVQGGELIYTKDANGVLQAWKITELRVEPHREFPADYWSAEGERRVVIATCGGEHNAEGYYSDNIFAVAVPVEVPA